MNPVGRSVESDETLIGQNTGADKIITVLNQVFCHSKSMLRLDRLVGMQENWNGEMSFQGNGCGQRGNGIGIDQIITFFLEILNEKTDRKPFPNRVVLEHMLDGPRTIEWTNGLADAPVSKFVKIGVSTSTNPLLSKKF